MVAETEGQRIKLVGFLEPAEGWKNQDDSPSLKIIVQDEGEFLIRNDALANQLKELVWEEVSLIGRLIENGNHKLIKVESFEGLLDQFDRYWDDDE